MAKDHVTAPATKGYKTMATRGGHMGFFYPNEFPDLTTAITPLLVHRSINNSTSRQRSEIIVFEWDLALI